MNKFLLLLLCPLAAYANCDQIHEMDQRNLCNAITKKNSPTCYMINNIDLKNFCVAVVTNNSSVCYSIRSNDRMNMCLALAKPMKRG